MTNEELIREMSKLSPWHQSIQLNSELNTNHFKSDMPDRIMVSHRASAKFLSKVYKDDLSKKSIIDCGCNAGALLFEAAKIGIGRGVGFDARELWINQANFVKNNITLYNTDNLEFRVMNLYDLPNTIIGNFDITMYSGLFYHVEDPFLSLKILSERTNELMIVNTMYEGSHNQNTQKDCLYFKPEGTAEPLSGVNGVAWNPSGENLLIELLKRLGFVEFELMFKRAVEIVPGSNGRLSLAASKVSGLLKKVVKK